MGHSATVDNVTLALTALRSALSAQGHVFPTPEPIAFPLVTKAVPVRCQSIGVCIVMRKCDVLSVSCSCALLFELVCVCVCAGNGRLLGARRGGGEPVI